MKIALCSLTKQGAILAKHLAPLLEADHYGKNQPDSREDFPGSLTELMTKIYPQYQALVMIMATGIVVRTLTSFLSSKTQDPAVVVLDEKGQFVISLLSGHLGGGNQLARKIGALLGATPVITTATDVNGQLAFDLLAQKNGWEIENIEALKYLNGALVNGQKVEFYTDGEIKGEIPAGIQGYQGGVPENLVLISSQTKNLPWGKHNLYLRPKNLYLGCGCKKNTSLQNLQQAIEHFMETNGYSLKSLKALCSIDLKKEEPALVAWSQAQQLLFLSFSGEELKQVPGVKSSAFVQSITGSGSVAEAAALLASGGRLLVGKTIYAGITLSLAESKLAFNWEIN